MAVEIAVMPTAHDAVSPVIYTQNAWPAQPLSPSMEPGHYIHSPVGSVASPHNAGSPLSHANSPLGVCSPIAVQSPHMQAHSPGMQAASPLHCQPLNVNVSVKQEFNGADFNCNNLTHLLRSGPHEFAHGFVNGLSCHLGPPAQREILDGKNLVLSVRDRISPTTRCCSNPLRFSSHLAVCLQTTYAYNALRVVLSCSRLQ